MRLLIAFLASSFPGSAGERGRARKSIYGHDPEVMALPALVDGRVACQVYQVGSGIWLSSTYSPTSRFL
jgi:hypothetical protein